MAQYSPVFTDMWQGGLIQPLFALGLSRNSPVDGSVAAPSYLAFGGLPPVDYDNSTWTRTPILGMQSEPGWGSLAEVKGLYIISADAHVYGEWNAAAPDPTDGVVVDGHNAVPDADRCGSSVRYYRPVRISCPLSFGSLVRNYGELTAATDLATALFLRHNPAAPRQ